MVGDNISLADTINMSMKLSGEQANGNVSVNQGLSGEQTNVSMNHGLCGEQTNVSVNTGLSGEQTNHSINNKTTENMNMNDISMQVGDWINNMESLPSNSWVYS